MNVAVRSAWTALVVVALAACTGGEADPSPSQSATPTAPATPDAAVVAESSPSPSPEPSVDPHPDANELIISPSGLGPLAIGNYPPADNPGAAMIQRDPDHCPSDGTEPGRWVPDGYAGADVDLAGNPVAPFAVEADVAAVHRIDVLGVGPRTEAGIGLGSSLTELQAAYPDALFGPVGDGPTSVWIWSGAEGSVAFETAEPQDGYTDAWLDPGDPETVLFIRVLHPETAAEFTVFGSENFAGGCPL